MLSICVSYYYEHIFNGIFYFINRLGCPWCINKFRQVKEVDYEPPLPITNPSLPMMPQPIFSMSGWSGSLGACILWGSWRKYGYENLNELMCKTVLAEMINGDITLQSVLNRIGSIIIFCVAGFYI